MNSTFSVLISSFSASATTADVLDFVRDFKPFEVSLRHSLYGQVATVAFRHRESAEILVETKDRSLFMGQTMKLRLAPRRRSNVRPSSSRRDIAPSVQHTPPPPSAGARTQQRPSGIRRSRFQILSAISCTRFVAVSELWRHLMPEFFQELQHFAASAKRGVDRMEPGVVYAVRDRTSGIWRRCRLVAEEPSGLVVEHIDGEALLMTTADQVVALPQRYRDWFVKTVELSLDGYLAASGKTETYKAIEDHLCTGLLEVEYSTEEMGPLAKDRLRVRSMRLNGESVPDALVQKGLLRRRQPARQG